jgi:hypothetical protein
MLISVTTLLIVGGLFIVCGAVTTVFITRAMRVSLTFGNVLASFLLSLVAGVLVASLAATIWANGVCAGQSPCEYAGFMEGGVVLVAVWLISYSLTYVVGGIVVARYQSRRNRHVERGA